MEIALWVIGIHLFEALGVILYLLFRKNSALEKIIAEQNQYIDAMSYVSSQLSSSLSKINDKMYVNGDEELEQIFEQVKEFKTILDDFSKK